MPRAALCPFYNKSRGEHLTCTADGDGLRRLLRVEFSRAGDCDRYRRRYCCGNWRGCSLAAALWDEYDRGG